ncbi:MAG: hypothetical protein EXR55_04785, partial [Dehalococcoidia bacterium]|nr:hypothetical protein [Dehalococcoidia bacterium]
VNDATSGVGFARPAQAQGNAPPPRPTRRVFNGYSYSVRAPANHTPEEEARFHERQGQIIRDTRRRWDEELVPTLVRETDAMKAVDLQAATRQDLLRHLEEFIALDQKHWYFHGLAVGPIMYATSLLFPLYAQITGSQDETEAYRLLQGFDNKSLETDRELRTLAQQARKDKGVATAFAEVSDWQALRKRLQATPAGEAFLARLQAFLDYYGNRSALLNIAEPTWQEDPSFVLITIRGLLQRKPEDEEPRRHRLVEERESLVQGALQRIGDNENKRQEFLDILGISQALWPIREDHSFYIDQMSRALVRRVLVECGRRLAQQGVLDLPQEVFFLTLPELKEALKAPEKAPSRSEIQRRKVEHERFSRITPPQFLGKTPPDGGLSDTSEGAKFVRAINIPLTEERPSLLRGAAASPGKASGVARVVRGPEEFQNVRPGDILVCRTTSPSWTPLFALIGGLVTDAGGVLSHGAIVAREYKLPAVTGTKHATRVILDGQPLFVDGATGVVRLG